MKVPKSELQAYGCNTNARRLVFGKERRQLRKEIAISYGMHLKVLEINFIHITFPYKYMNGF